MLVGVDLAQTPVDTPRVAAVLVLDGTSELAPPFRLAEGAVRGYASWADEDFPAESNGITYAIQGARGDLAGPTSDAFVVTLGMGGGGLTATMSPASAAPLVKMAA